jgi:hypothetical protein
VQYQKGIGDGGRSGTSPGSVEALCGGKLTYRVCAEGMKAVFRLVVEKGVVVG